MYAPPSPATSASEKTIQIADWIELNVLTTEESSVSIAEVTATLATEPPIDSTASEHRFDYSDTVDDIAPSDSQIGYWQQAEQTAEHAFAELSERSKRYGARYPLTVGGEIATRSACFDSGDVAAFLTLLRSRHLYHRALGDSGKLAGELFERLLPHAMRVYLGLSEETSLRFGVAGGSRGSGLPIETDAALDELSQRANEPRGDLTGLPKGWDYGADVIAWKPLGDSLRGKLVAIGQATISEEEWTCKQPSPKWKSGRLVRFLTHPMIVVAFVESISLTTSAVLDGLPETFSALPLDRFRILFILRDRDIPGPLRTEMKRWNASMRARLPR